jgi:hypothetical protein
MRIKFSTASGEQLAIANGQCSPINEFPFEMQRHIAQSILEASELALSIQGPRALGSSRRTAAIHEAGHTVVAQATAGSLFPPPHGVRVFQETGLALEVGEAWLGCTDYPPETPDYIIEPGDVRGLHIKAFRTLAGVLAEQLFAPHDYRLGSSLDEQFAALVPARYIAYSIGRNPMEVYYHLIRLTGDILTHNKRHLLTVATWLEKHPKLDGKRLKKMLIGVALPEFLASFGLGGGK